MRWRILPVTALAMAAVLAACASFPDQAGGGAIRYARADWEAIPAEDLLVFEFDRGRVVIELAPRSAPEHVAQLRALTRVGYYNDSAILRAQDDYVVEWGDPTGVRGLSGVPQRVAPEKTQPANALGDAFIVGVAPDGRTQAYLAGFPMLIDTARVEAWTPHCRALVGAVHADPADSPGGLFLYAVIGDGPRSLDRGLAIVGRVIEGLELLDALPRGEGTHAFYREENYIPIPVTRLASEMPADQRPVFARLREGGEGFQRWLAAERSRDGEAWDVCDALPPIRHVRR